MNAMTISTNPLVQAIGWALLHLVWEGFLVTAILAAALALMQRRSANARYLASCAALLVLVVLGAATAVRAYEPSAVMTASTSPAVGQAQAPAPILATAGTEVLPAIAFVKSHLAQIVALWLLGVVILSARLVAGWLGAHRLTNRRTHAAPVEWEQSLRRIAAALHVRRPIRLLESAAVEVPAVVGWLRPIVLLPVATLSGLSVQQIEMILAHEMAHIRRHDFIVNLVQSVLETLLFYHPGVWWISRRIRIEREHCCDDLAVALFGDPLLYAHALTRFEELRVDAQSVVAAGGGSLLARVRRLVATRAESSGWTSRWAAGAALLTVLVAILVAPSLPLFANHQPAPPLVVANPQPPSTAVKHGVKEGVRGGVTGGVVTDKSKCSESSNSEIDVDAKVVDPDEPPLPPMPPVPPAPMVRVAPAIALAPFPPMVAPIVRESMALAQTIAGNVIGDLDFDGNLDIRGHEIGKNGKLSVDDLITLKSLNVTPKYIEEMRSAGLGLLSLNDLASLRMARVTPEFVREMRQAGYAHLSVRELEELRMQGLTPAFVKSLAEAGYANLPVKDLLRLRAMGVDGDFIRELSKYRTK